MTIILSLVSFQFFIVEAYASNNDTSQIFLEVPTDVDATKSIDENIIEPPEDACSKALLYLQLLSENGGQRVVEMDTMEGVKGGKVLQTFIWRENGLMLAYLQEKQTMQCMAETLDQLEERLGLETFRELFPVTLTDNGKEFEDPDLFEANPLMDALKKRY